MGPVITVSPFKCRMWRLHDRLEDHITEETCKAEIQSFIDHGQLVPVLGRRIERDPDYEIELIYGARRLFVARAINRPLLVEVRPIADRDAIVAMDAENRHRRDISPYERGLCYARWLREAHFESQEDIAHALNISASQVSRMLKLARLPTVIINAFGSALEICEGWGMELADAMQDEDRRRRTIQAARTIAAMMPRPPAREVYRRLLHAAASGRRPKKAAHDQVVKDDNGTTLFRIRHQRSSIALLLPLQNTSVRALEKIRRTVTEILSNPVTEARVIAADKQQLATVIARCRSDN